MGKKRETNEEFVKRIINFGPTGALQQVFVMQALEKYAQAVAGSTPEALDTPLVSGKAWHDTAIYIGTELKKHFAS